MQTGQGRRHWTYAWQMLFVFEDSEVAQVQIAPGQLQLRFSAARLLAETQSGSGQGGWQKMLLICELPEPVSIDSTVAGRLESGCVMAAGQRWPRLPVPYVVQQALVLELEFASGQRWRIAGTALRLEPVAQEGAATASFQC